MAGEMVTLEGSLLIRLMNTPPDGAGTASVTGNGAVWPNCTFTLAGRMIPGCGAETVTPAAAVPKLGVEAEIVAVPAATPVTGTATWVALAAKATVAGTVATPVLVELKVTVAPPAGAGADRFSVRFCVEPAPSVKVAGMKELDPPAAASTCICPLPDR